MGSPQSLIPKHLRGSILGVLVAAVAVVGLAPQCILIPEDNFTGELETNHLPVARITGGVLGDSLDTDNFVRFYWFGADDDGIVRWFEWAVDDTISEMAWHRTTRFEETIFTRAIHPVPGGNRDSDWHTFFVRSVDNHYARSKPDSRFFNANTIAPTSRIDRPHPVDGARWAATLRMTWEGEDLDASGADRTPAFFEIKHVLNPGIDPTRQADVVRLFEETPNLLLAPLEVEYPADDPRYLERAQRAWKRVPGSVHEQWIAGMAIGSSYGFAVRAIDEAGASERKFVRNENWVFFQIRDALITVVVYEPSMGAHRFDAPVFGNPWEVTLAPNQRFRFRWVADASASGSEPGPCNYGFDIADPEDPLEPFRATDGLGGWIGWAPRSQMQDAISFPADGPKTHYFYLKMRDISNRRETETKCVIEITVADFSFTKRFLVVDDQRRRPQSPNTNALPNDDAHEDAWRSDVLGSMGNFLPLGEQPGGFNVFPDENTSPAIEIPDGFLNTLGEYRTVIWDCAGGDEVGLKRAALDMLLSRYVGAGGNMLLFTWVGPVTKITGGFSERAAEPKQPQPDDLSPDQAWNQFGFLWQHLHLRGAVDKPRGEDRARDRRSLVRAVAADPTYPDIPLDYARWGGPAGGRGSHYFECLVPTPTEPGIEPWYERDPALQTIYTARCWTDIGHDLNDRPIAWRTFASHEDVVQGLDRGKIVNFSFHPYYFDVGATEMAFSQALFWLSKD
jgi:hypothetical protein